MSKWILTAGCAALPFLAHSQTNTPQSSLWYIRDIYDRLTFTGSRTIGYQTYHFVGDSDAFGSLTNYGTGLQHFTDIGNLSVQGSKVLGVLDFRATFTDNRFSDPEQQQYTLSYKKGYWDLNYGTVQASLLNTNRFASFSRSLDGFSGGFKQGRTETKFISSEARGATRTITIEGNNTPGPYYLSSGRIIGGSIRILLDGVELQQGVDYLVDTSIGSISFLNRVIPPTSAIVASFESYDVNGGGGSIRGGAFAYDLGGGLGKIGFSAQEQLVGSASTTNERADQFQGYGFPGAQYVLNYVPIPASIIVTVDGIVRSFSIVDDHVSEFYLSPANPNVIIARTAIPSTQILQIRYIPQSIQAVNGNRRVSGFDWHIPLDKSNGSGITYSKAIGKMDGGSSGGAEGVDLRLVNGNGTVKVGFRKIDPGFQTIEQTNFNRNEDVAEYSYEYKTKGVTTTLGTSNNLITSLVGSTFTSSRVVNDQFNIRFSDPKKSAVDANRSQSFTYNRIRVSSTDNTSLNSLAFNDNFHNKRLTFGYGIENDTGHGRVNGSLTDIGVQSYKTNATYSVSKNMALIASASKSFIQTDTIHSEGYDYFLRANMTQTGPWTAGVEFAQSDSGVLASLGGFLNGSSLGYGTGGFGGTGGTGVVSTGQLKLNRVGFNATHQAGDALTMSMSYSTTKSVGSSTNNAKIDTIGFNSSWKINNSNTLVLDLVKVKSDFLTSFTGNSDSNVISFMLLGDQGKLWSYRFGYNLMTTAGGGNGQNNFGADADITYRINSRSRLFTTTSLSRTRGIYPQNDTSFQAGYAYNITHGISLIGKYSYRNLQNLDPLAIGGAFRANGLSLELGLDFSTRH